MVPMCRKCAAQSAECKGWLERLADAKWYEGLYECRPNCEGILPPMSASRVMDSEGE